MRGMVILFVATTGRHAVRLVILSGEPSEKRGAKSKDLAVIAQ